MSEASTPKEQSLEQPVVEQVTTPEPVAAKPAASGKGLAAMALLIALGGAAAGGWSAWQTYQGGTHTQQQLSQIGEVQAQLSTLSQSVQGAEQQRQTLQQRLDQLPSSAELETQRRLVSRLQGDQQLLNERLETVLGASRQEWRIAEAEHLLRLASLRLSALQDIPSATALVKAADDIITELDDPAAYAAREQLAKSLVALRSTHNPDRLGLFLQISALREQAAQLNALAPVFDGEGGALREWAQEPGGEQQWWQRALETLSEYFRLDFDADRNIKPMLAGQELGQVRLALNLALEQAQWGALHGQAGVFRQAMDQARGTLDTYFDADHPNSRTLRTQIVELSQRPIEVSAPDLTPALNAVQAYIEAKLSARAQAIAPAVSAPEQAAPEQQEAQ
ncbi:uroporphyrinogen-III C-methyltransferase [Pseudomonas sp. TTU2014-080ASC]|uniref:uroporphyrinogen-III C-methyltransferase n=1 Tax=Pseudomonas sp. TTU2014-080ASC TaxID=1729724 RepID=UPI000718881D|nr:uroporphyrinogen-III C-methyltransferase [Pseudomonas sp. TTU2014-080ASC]KRW61359.1 heme biosynthesis operon protein HemX [Pseudomonas sp. TTU2014-080ASC]